jgi:anti-sigma regulatory factor (Ser/Thr protein kinase)
MSGSTPLSDDRLMISLEGVDFDFQEFTCGQVEDINKLIDTIVHDCIEHHLPKERQIEFKLGITEALSNAVRHGPLDHDVNKTIKIGYRIDNGHFKMSIIDSGPGFNWQVYNYASIDDVFEDSEGGRGVPLLLEIFDKVTWNYLGNHIGLFFYW